MLTLYIGNKNYSSWSMRPWVLLKQLGVPFEEVKVRFDAFTPESNFKQTLSRISPTARVPVLVDQAQQPPLVVWDTLAIVEYLAEYVAAQGLPGLTVWPQDPAARARARSICAEMHAGFGALRSHCMMNIEAHLPEVGALIWRDQPAVRADVARIVAMWQALLAQHAGPMLFGPFSAADAYYAPVCMRLRSYALPVPPEISAYVERVCALPGVRAWIDDALAEHDFLEFEEPYRLRR